MPLLIHLQAAPNPDHGQFTSIWPIRTIVCDDLDQAAAAYHRYNQWYELGGGNCGLEHGLIFDATGLKGYLSPNGRYWELPYEGDCKYDKRINADREKVAKKIWSRVQARGGVHTYDAFMADIDAKERAIQEMLS